MSNFMPEGKPVSQFGAPSSDHIGLGREEHYDDLDRIRLDVERLFSHPEFLPAKFLGHIVDYLAINQPPIPLGLIQGYQLGVFRSNEIATSESTTSSTYTDLTTPGPTLSNLSDGTWLIVYGFRGYQTSGRHASMSLSYNGSAASDDDVVGTTYTDFISVTRTKLKVLSNSGSNEVECKYNGGTSGTAHFAQRFLVMSRLGNVT